MKFDSIADVLVPTYFCELFQKNCEYFSRASVSLTILVQASVKSGSHKSKILAQSLGVQIYANKWNLIV